jgi:hypothetical protein
LDVMKQAIEQVKLPRDYLLYAASDPNVFCTHEKLAYLLGKAHYPIELGDIIRNGIRRVFDVDKHSTIPALLTFLEGRVLLGVNLHDIAVRATFLEQARKHTIFYVHPNQIPLTIDSRIYGDALVYAGGKDPQDTSFRGLLPKADENDLEAALSSRVEGSQNGEFRAAINRALSKAIFGGTKLHFPIMTAWITRNIFDEDLNVEMPRAIAAIVIAYITDEQLPTRRNIDVGEGQAGRIMTQDAQLPNLVKELMKDGHYVTAYNCGRTMGNERFKEYLYSSITTVKHYFGAFRYLTEGGALGDFLVKGIEAVAIAAIRDIKAHDKMYISTNTISDALKLAFKDNNFGRVVCLLVALKGRCEVEDTIFGNNEMMKLHFFSKAAGNMFSMLSVNEFGSRAKRFLVLHGDKLAEEHPVILREFSTLLGKQLQAYLNAPETREEARELLTVLARQPIPLSMRAFFEGLLNERGMAWMPFYFGQLEWRELLETLIFGNEKTGRILWSWLIRNQINPSKYFGEYPSSSYAREAFLGRFKTKEMVENEWMSRESVPILETLNGLFIFPTVLSSIVAQYGIAW